MNVSSYPEINTKAKNAEPHTSVEAQKRNLFNSDMRRSFISLAPTEPVKNNIINDDMPNQRFISKSAMNAPRTPIQLPTDPRFFSKSTTGTFSILLWSAPPVKKNEINASPTYNVMNPITNPVI